MDAYSPKNDQAFKKRILSYAANSFKDLHNKKFDKDSLKEPRTLKFETDFKGSSSKGAFKNIKSTFLENLKYKFHD